MDDRTRNLVVGLIGAIGLLAILMVGVLAYTGTLTDSITTLLGGAALGCIGVLGGVLTNRKVE